MRSDNENDRALLEPSTGSPRNITFRWIGNLVDPSAPAPKPKILTPTILYFCRAYLAQLPERCCDTSEGYSHPVIHTNALSSGHASLIEARRLIRSSMRDGQKAWRREGGTSVASINDYLEGIYHQVRTRPLYLDAADWQSTTLEADGKLATMQSYLMLTLHLFYTHVIVSIDRHLVQLQDLYSACLSLRLAHRTQQHAYVFSESVRRAGIVICVLDNIYSFQAGLGAYVAQDLGPALASGPLALWTLPVPNGNDGPDVRWQERWQRHCTEWRANPDDATGHGGGFRMCEMWGRGDDESRIQRWLAEADAFGMWTYALTEMMGIGRGSNRQSSWYVVIHNRKATPS